MSELSTSWKYPETRMALRLKTPFQSTNLDASTNSDAPGNPADWISITAQVREGDPSALATLYNHCFQTVFNEIRRITGRDESTCLDLTQDTFLNVIRRIKPIEAEQHLQAWIRTVARTTTYDWLRREARDLQRRHRHGEQQPQLPLIAGDSTAPDGADLLDDSRARILLLQEKLEALPVELQEMISLRYRLGWSLARIGRRFGLKTGAVDGRIRRAMNKIRLQFDEGNHA